MTRPLNRRFVLAGRTHGMPTAANVWPEEASMPEPGAVSVTIADPLEAAS